MRQCIQVIGLLTLTACANHAPQTGTKTGNRFTLEFGTTEQLLTLDSCTDSDMPAPRDAGMETGENTDAGSIPGSAKTHEGLVTQDRSGTLFFIQEGYMAVTEVELRATTQIPCECFDSFMNIDCDDDNLRIREDFTG